LAKDSGSKVTAKSYFPDPDWLISSNFRQECKTSPEARRYEIDNGLLAGNNPPYCKDSKIDEVEHIPLVAVVMAPCAVSI